MDKIKSRAVHFSELSVCQLEQLLCGLISPGYILLNLSTNLVHLVLESMTLTGVITICFVKFTVIKSISLYKVGIE